MPCVSANPCSAWGTKARRLPIAVGDKVRVRDDKTSDYWSAVVKSIEVDGMMLQWESDDGPDAYVYVPLGSVRGKGAEGGYGDGYVLQETGANDDASVASRTIITVNSSIQRAGGTGVRQPAEEINLLVVLADDTVRDLYLCAVLISARPSPCYPLRRCDDQDARISGTNV